MSEIANNRSLEEFCWSAECPLWLTRTKVGTRFYGRNESDLKVPSHLTRAQETHALAPHTIEDWRSSIAYVLHSQHDDT